jgi:hypothetical protein
VAVIVLLVPLDKKEAKRENPPQTLMTVPLPTRLLTAFPQLVWMVIHNTA